MRFSFLTALLPTVVAAVLWLAGCPAIAGPSGSGQEPISNAALIPKVLPDSEVGMEGMSPDWVKTLIMAELRIETATPEGTFASAVKVLDHYAEMGVNGLWICPVQERGSRKNGYGNFGPATLEPRLTAGADFHESCKVVRRFVEEAHRRNIRVIFDIVVWGTRKDAPLVTTHPEFYKRLPDGKFWEVWGGYGFDWSHAGFRSWYRDAAVNFIMETGADGCRVDLAPDTSGYFFKEVREAVYAKGRKIILMAEMPAGREDTFDFEQNGVTGWTEEPDYAHPDRLKQQHERFGKHSDALLRSNLVEMIRTGAGIGQATVQQQGRGGAFRFYTQNLLNHDDGEPFVLGSRVRFGYTAVFAPLIPLWWIGEEWNNPKTLIPEAEGGVMFFNFIDWAAKEQPGNREFFEDVKKYLRIRRSHPDIFERFPDETRQANLTAVDSTRNGVPNPLQAYARYAGQKAVLVVPNYEGPAGESGFEIRVPLEKLKFPATAGKLRATDLLTGERLLEIAIAAASVPKPALTTKIRNDHLAVILVETE
ncbi:MAG: hypothetical protein JWM59_902 [Verrucomicrobiales bacterium]|nr:hypothetical protein [Verrucomicrobiales bacterium]